MKLNNSLSTLRKSLDLTQKQLAEKLDIPVERVALMENREIDNNFTNRLIQSRARLGYSQKELSKLTGIAASQISRYELGDHKPRSKAILKLATHLKVSFSWLAYGKYEE